MVLPFILHTKEKKERPFIKPYSFPIFTEEVAVICTKESGFTTSSNWPKDFSNKTIGMNDGYSLEMGGKDFVSMVNNKSITIDYSDGNNTNIRKLKFRRIDGYLNDKMSTIWTISKLKSEISDLDITSFNWGPTISKEKAYVGFAANASKFPYKEDFVKKLDKILKEMVESGEVSKIVDEYLAK